MLLLDMLPFGAPRPSQSSWSCLRAVASDTKNPATYENDEKPAHNAVNLSVGMPCKWAYFDISSAVGMGKNWIRLTSSSGTIPTLKSLTRL
jgi:hypothetical protein